LVLEDECPSKSEVGGSLLAEARSNYNNELAIRKTTKETNESKSNSKK